jgi:tetratricopeptide (TPR) repeat protein
MKNILLWFVIWFFMPFAVAQKNTIKNKSDATATLQKAIDLNQDLDCNHSMQLSYLVLGYALKTNDLVLVSKSYNIIGLNFEDYGDYTKAEYYYNESLKFAKESKSIQEQDFAYNNLGNFYLFVNNELDKALFNYQKCYEFTLQRKNKLDIALILQMYI